MIEHINRRDAIGEFERCNAENPRWTPQRVKALLLRMPAADVAPVVRCKDCKHSYEDLGGLYCSYGPCVDCPVSPDFWCANGSRREDAHAQD